MALILLMYRIFRVNTVYKIQVRIKFGTFTVVAKMYKLSVVFLRFGFGLKATFSEGKQFCLCVATVEVFDSELPVDTHLK